MIWPLHIRYMRYYWRVKKCTVMSKKVFLKAVIITCISRIFDKSFFKAIFVLMTQNLCLDAQEDLGSA